MEWTPKTIIITAVGTVTTISTIVGAFLAIDTRYAKATELRVDLNYAKNEIISEMRREVVKNRSVMIASMQREADELEYQMSVLEEAEKPVPRYMQDKFKQITRQIAELKK